MYTTVTSIYAMIVWRLSRRISPSVGWHCMWVSWDIF